MPKEAVRKREVTILLTKSSSCELKTVPITLRFNILCTIYRQKNINTIANLDSSAKYNLINISFVKA